MCIEKTLQFPFSVEGFFFFSSCVRRETCRRNNTELSCYCSVLNCTGFVCLLSAPSPPSWAYPITPQCSSANSCLGRYCELWRGMLGYISIKMFRIKAYSVILLWRWKTIQQKITFEWGKFTAFLSFQASKERCFTKLSEWNSMRFCCFEQDFALDDFPRPLPPWIIPWSWF